jgi:hypothetical protein
MQAITKVLLLSGTAAILLMGLARTPALAGTECGELVANKCATCHFVKYICPRIEKGKGTLSWKGIVKDMVKEGMTATDQEQEKLVGCLADPDVKVKAICGTK